MRVLVAGLGNIFHGDDGVGVAVAQALLTRPVPDGVTVRDYGIRGVHLAYELLEEYDLAVLVDAVQRGGEPGTIHVVEHSPGPPAGGDVLVDAHDLAPDDVLALVPTLGGTLGRVVIVGVEVAEMEPTAELSPAVRAAVPAAVDAVLRVVADAGVSIGGNR